MVSNEWIILFLLEKFFKAKTVITLLWFHKQNEKKKKSLQFMQFEEHRFYNKLVYITLNNRNRAGATTNYFHDRNQQYGSNLPKSIPIINSCPDADKPMLQKLKSEKK